VNSPVVPISPPVQIGFEFANPVTISTVVVLGRLNTDRAYNPSAYTIETSDTGADNSWTVQATLTSAEAWPITASPAGWPVATNASSKPIVTTLPTPVVAKWVRLRITETYYATNGTSNQASLPNTQIAELEIH
jgi:hypothetical protein